VTKGQVIFKESQASDWERHQLKMSEREVEKERKETRSIQFANLVIKSGAKRYGLPADAKERRM